MREILFRGKRISNEKWVYGGITRRNHPNFSNTPYVICANNKDYFVDENTIGQYTGLKDKNGIKIFEGDVLMYAPNQRNCIRFDVVVADKWNCGCCNCVFGFSTKDGWIDLQKHEDCEVISNIHDNPDFLESEAE